MPLATTVDLFYLVLSVAVAWVAVFLCWGLYEMAHMMHQANVAVREAREKLSRLEKSMCSIKERLESSAEYLGVLAEGGKAVMNMFNKHEERKEKRRGKKSRRNEDED